MEKDLTKKKKEAAPKNTAFADRLIQCLSKKGIDYIQKGRPSKEKESLKSFAIRNAIPYTSLQKCVAEQHYGFVPAWDMLVTLANELNVTVDYLLAREEPAQSPGRCATDCPLVSSGKKIIDLCRDVKEVVDSGTHWGASLEANIHSFRTGYDNDQKSIKNSRLMENLIQDNKGLKEEIGKLKTTVSELQAANDHQGRFSKADIAPPTGTDEGDGTEP